MNDQPRIDLSVAADARAVRRLVSLSDLDGGELNYLIDRANELAASGRAAVRSLTDRVVGLHFDLTSTRTRTSFVVGAKLLGAHVVQYGPNDLQINTGESQADTMSVLGGFLDLLVVRSAVDSATLTALSEHARLPIVNAMSFDEHPTQAITDFSMMKRHFGRLHGLKVLYVGEGNSTAVALAMAASRIPGLRLYLGTPAGYGLAPSVLEQVADWSGPGGGEVVETHDLDRLPARSMDVVYTARWQTTGTSKPDPSWREKFAPFKVTPELMRTLGSGPDAVFMHDLPAHRGEDVDAEVLDGPQSIAFEQAHHKLHAAMAVLEWCLEGPRR